LCGIEHKSEEWKAQRAKVIMLSFNEFRRDSHFAIDDLIRDVVVGKGKGVEVMDNKAKTHCLSV
jgi:hypothetical protein